MKTGYQLLPLRLFRIVTGCFFGLILFVSLLALLQASSDATVLTADLLAQLEAAGVAVPQEGDTSLTNWSANQLVNDDIGTAEQMHPDVAVSGNGYVYIVWADKRNGNWDIYGQRYTGDGTKLGNNFKVDDDNGSYDQTDPAVCTDDRGNLIIVWSDNREWWNPLVYGQRYDNQGNQLGGNFLVSEGGWQSFEPDVACQADGRFTVVWTDDNGIIYARRYHSDGTPIEDAFRVDDGTVFAHFWNLKIAIGGNGEFVVVWADDRDGSYSDIYAQRFDSAGNPIGSNQKLNDDIDDISHDFPAVALDVFGNAYVVWEDYRRYGAGDDLYFDYSTSGSSEWGSDLIINDNWGSVGSGTDIGVDGQEGIVVVWRDHQSSSGRILSDFSLNGGVSWGIDQSISDAGDMVDQSAPALAVSAQGDAYAAWVDDRNGNNDIYFAYRLQGSRPAPGLSISGRVTGTNNSPISGVTISATGGYTATTDDNGNYTLSSLAPGTYTVTPSNSGYSFSPAQRTVNVTQDITGQDFLGLADGGPPTPFLDLPFDYGSSVSAFQQVLRNWSHSGRVNSWFDHRYPDYGYNNGTGIWLYNDTFTDNPYWVDPDTRTILCYDSYCYDGHNGLDFTYEDPEPEMDGNQDLFIVSPAAGEVVDVNNTCPNRPDSQCGGGYGNYVILYHNVDNGNGYFTRYAHLASISDTITTGITVTVGYTLGVMGNSGRSGGTHLHFGVYRDTDGDGAWDGENVDMPVDPFGWEQDVPDPWSAIRHAPVSSRLWLYDPDTERSFAGSEGAVITDTTGSLQATIPPAAVSGQATLELSPVPVAAASAQLRSSGHSFWLRLLEWLPGDGGLQSAAALQSTAQFTLTQPITLTVTYTDTDVLHLDVAQLTLYRWNEEQETWRPLPTTVDPDNRVATAQTQDLGEFDLQSPLLCPTDDLEPDDGYPVGRWIWPNDWPMARGLDVPQDSDWARFDAVQGARYTIRTQNLAGGANTVLNLYDVDALTLLVSNDDAGGGPASELVWTAPYTGTFFVKVVSAPSGTTDCSATYELIIATIPGDVIADCRVDIQDLQAVANRWRLNAVNSDPDGDFTTPNYETRFDLDRDGDVDIEDIMIVAAHLGELCS